MGSGIHPLIPSAFRPKWKKQFEIFLKQLFLSENKRKGIHQLTVYIWLRLLYKSLRPNYSLRSQHQIYTNVMLTSSRVHSGMKPESKLADFPKHMEFYTPHVIKVNTESCHSHYFVPIFADKSQKNKKRLKPSCTRARMPRFSKTGSVTGVP